MSDIRRFKDVPDGSLLQVSASSEQEGWAISTQVLTSHQPPEVWAHRELVPGPRNKLLASPRASFLDFNVAFQEKASVEIVCRVLRPDGTPHSSPVTWTVEGDNGDVEARGLFVETER